MFAVVINRGQTGSVPAMREALRGLKAVFVFDRTDEARLPFQSSDETAVWSNGWGGFLAGRMRDLGLMVADSKGLGNDDVLFLDGDKVPRGDLSILPRMPAGCVLLGTQSDPRPWMRGTGRVPVKQLGDTYNGFYSCGLFMRRGEVEKVRALNGGRLFHPVFDGLYGEEDRYLGDCLCALGTSVWHTDRVTLSGSLGMYHGREEQLGNNMIKRMKMRDSLYERFGRLGGYYDAA